MKTTCEENQRKRRKTLFQERERRVSVLLAQGRIKNAMEIPDDAIPAVTPNSVRLFFRDEEITCCECGKKETWKAEDQQWYFEIAHGSVFAKAIRCRACRVEKRSANQQSVATRLAGMSAVGPPSPAATPAVTAPSVTDR